MRYTLILLIVSSSLALARERPQMTWQGYVNGSAVLYIQGKRVDAQGRTTGAVDRLRYRFASALPATRAQAKMTVRRGRGRVEIVEQPVPENEYSLVVRIDGPDSRHEYYVLDFYWNANSARRDDRESQTRTAVQTASVNSHVPAVPPTSPGRCLPSR